MTTDAQFLLKQLEAATQTIDALEAQVERLTRERDEARPVGLTTGEVSGDGNNAACVAR